MRTTGHWFDVLLVATFGLVGAMACAADTGELAVEDALEQSDFNCREENDCWVCEHRANVSAGQPCSEEGAQHLNYESRRCQWQCRTPVCGGPDEWTWYTAENTSLTVPYQCFAGPGSGSGAGGGSAELTWAPGVGYCRRRGEQACVPDEPTLCDLGSGSGAGSTQTFEIRPMVVKDLPDGDGC